MIVLEYENGCFELRIEKIVTISNICHKVVVTISDIYCTRVIKVAEFKSEVKWLLNGISKLKDKGSHLGST